VPFYFTAFLIVLLAFHPRSCLQGFGQPSSSSNHPIA